MLKVIKVVNYPADTFADRYGRYLSTRKVFRKNPVFKDIKACVRYYLSNFYFYSK